MRGANVLKTLAILMLLGACTMTAQYTGRGGVRYRDQGNTFQVKRSNGWSETRRDGKCTIRVRIDDQADVELRGEQIRIRPISGGPGRDEGSECNAPLPTSGNLNNFRFQGIDGRGTPRLVQEPGARNYYVAVVNIRDPKSGDEGYTFDLFWEWDGSTSGSPTTRPGSGGGFFPGSGSGSSGGNSGGGFFPGTGSGGGMPDMNVSMAGQGQLRDSSRTYQLRDIRVQVRNGNCTVNLATNQGQQVEMTGRVRNSDTCEITRGSNGNVTATARFQFDGNQIRSMQMSGTQNGQQFSANFRAR